MGKTPTLWTHCINRTDHNRTDSAHSLATKLNLVPYML